MLVPGDWGAIAFAVLGFALAVILGRVLGAGWRKRRRDDSERSARANESRQVRRARERGK